MEGINDKTLKLQHNYDTSVLTNNGELLRQHYRLGHLFFLKMRILMMIGILPKKLLYIRPPVCACSLAGSMTKKSNRIQGGRNKLRRATKSGDCISIDQIESNAPRYLGVLRRFIIKKQYTCVTIFVDHYSCTFYYPQCSTNTEKTLKAKRAFEFYCRSLGVKILHYHADNERFYDKGFMVELPPNVKIVISVEPTHTGKMESYKRKHAIFRSTRKK